MASCTSEDNLLRDNNGCIITLHDVVLCEYLYINGKKTPDYTLLGSGKPQTK